MSTVAPIGDVTGLAAAQPVTNEFDWILRLGTDAAGESTLESRIDDLLRTVGRRLCHLLDVRRCSVYLRADDGLFHGRVGWARDKPIDASIRRLVAGFEQDLFTREVSTLRAAVLVRNACTDPRAFTSTMVRWQVRDMLGVPLVVGDDVIGIVYLDDEGRPCTFTPPQLQLAESITFLGGVAIRQAVMVDQARRQCRMIDDHRTRLARMTEAQTQLNRAAANGADASQLVALVAQLAAKPVALYDRDCTPMAWSGTDLPADAAPGLHARMRSKVDHLSNSSPSVLIAPAPEGGLACRQVVCPVVSEQTVMGYVALLEVGGQITPLDRTLLEHAAAVLALELRGTAREIAAERKSGADVLRDLLVGGGDPSALERRATLHGISPVRPHLLVELSDVDGPGNFVAAVATGLDVTARVVVTTAHSVVAFVPVDVADPHADIDRVRTMAHHLLRTLAAARGANVVISDVCHGVEQFAASYSDMRELHEITRTVGVTGRVLVARDLAVMRLALSKDPVNAMAFARRSMSALLDHNAHTQDLLTTLRVFLACSAQVRATARKLAVHENTVRYRLGRVESIAGIRVDDLDALLTAQFSLRLLELSGELDVLDS